MPAYKNACWYPVKLVNSPLGSFSPVLLLHVPISLKQDSVAEIFFMHSCLLLQLNTVGEIHQVLFKERRFWRSIFQWRKSVILSSCLYLPKAFFIYVVVCIFTAWCNSILLHSYATLLNIWTNVKPAKNVALPGTNIYTKKFGPNNFPNVCSV